MYYRVARAVPFAMWMRCCRPVSHGGTQTGAATGPRRHTQDWSRVRCLVVAAAGRTGELRGCESTNGVRVFDVFFPFCKFLTHGTNEASCPTSTNPGPRGPRAAAAAQSSSSNCRSSAVPRPIIEPCDCHMKSPKVAPLAIGGALGCCGALAGCCGVLAAGSDCSC